MGGKLLASFKKVAEVLTDIDYQIILVDDGLSMDLEASIKTIKIF